MIWTIVILIVVVGGWYWYEGGWNRQLFTAAPGCVCSNLNADQANAGVSSSAATMFTGL